jgi:hypothetical protein
MGDCFEIAARHTPALNIIIHIRRVIIGVFTYENNCGPGLV